jgi:NADH:ubiquinone oxidoreductase subunit 5 (subunit L)/multisubunit Na+/H+ antiporter MnhA subunit
VFYSMACPSFMFVWLCFLILVGCLSLFVGFFLESFFFFSRSLFFAVAGRGEESKIDELSLSLLIKDVLVCFVVLLFFQKEFSGKKQSRSSFCQGSVHRISREHNRGSVFDTDCCS